MKIIRIGDEWNGTIINVELLAWVEYESTNSPNAGAPECKITLHFSGQTSKTFEGDVAEQVWKRIESLTAMQSEVRS